MEDRNHKVRKSLSELPENVLALILSFLPTKEAVRTSILSKRWEYIWTSMPELFFGDWNEPSMDFVNIVNRALGLRGPFDLTSFYLSCPIYELKCGDVDVMPQIEAWISDVVRFNVQDVELNLFADSPLTLPFSLVNCRSLTSLTILTGGGITLEFPSPICFSNLKKLELIGVIFPNEHSTQKLFSGCPLLEDFKLEECDWEYVKAVSLVSPPRLQNFTMIEDENQFHPSFNGDEFVISGGGLKYFHYEGEFQFEFNILNSQLLEEVHINFYARESGSLAVINHFLKLLRYTPNVPNLRLTNALCLLDIPEVVIQVPVFNGVRHLELDYETSDLSNKGLLKMLQNIPFLESLAFLEGIKMPPDPIDEDNILNPLPTCFLHCLDFIYIFIKKGDAKELMVVKVLLENAMALVEMAVKFSELVNKDIRINFFVELLKLPRGSRYCGIYIRE